MHKHRRIYSVNDQIKKFKKQQLGPAVEFGLDNNSTKKKAPNQSGFSLKVPKEPIKRKMTVIDDLFPNKETTTGFGNRRTKSLNIMKKSSLKKNLGLKMQLYKNSQNRNFSDEKHRPKIIFNNEASIYGLSSNDIANLIAQKSILSKNIYLIRKKTKKKEKKHQ